MTHTQWCLTQQKIREGLRTEWIRKWPNYCRKCEGWGMNSVYESHGFAFGPSEQIMDVCKCTAVGKCPRCGSHAPDDVEELEVCMYCGWNYVDPDVPLPEWGCSGDCCLLLDVTEL